jgi:hypothetical protein
MSETFTRALVRPPARSFADGLTTVDLGAPVLARALEQHEAYCEALVACGLELLHLPADDRYPDSTFVEDTAVIARGAAIVRGPARRAGPGGGRIGASRASSAGSTRSRRRAPSTAATSARRAGTCSSGSRTARTRGAQLALSALQGLTSRNVDIRNVPESCI